MFMFASISGAVIGVMGAAQSTVNNTTLSREFIQSGQIADSAVQDAIFQLNERPGVARPTAAAPKTGNVNGGKWEWYVTNTGTVRTGPQLSIHAEGTYAKTTRNATATAAALTVGSFTTGADGQLSYELSPKSAFQHLLFGRDVTAQNGTGIGAASYWLVGAVGATSASVNVNDQPSYPSKMDANFSLYGASAATAPISDARRAPVGLRLDSKFAADNVSRCANPEAWVASKNGGRILANDNTGCFSSMDFDVPTVIEGSNAFNAFVSGGVIIRNNISVPSVAALNIYTNGNVDFKTEDPALATTSLSVTNTFIYAAKGRCQTVPFASTSKTLFFTGSIACDTIKVAGKFATVPAKNPLGDEVYDSDIWYLTDYRQPSGSRG
jgi:hypothetical protein